MHKSGEIINGYELIEKGKEKGKWLVKHNCGRIYEARLDCIKFQKSCMGCWQEYHDLHSGSNHASWKGCGELSSDYYTTIKHSAIDREFEFNISIEYMWNLFLKQDRKCALSGMEIFFHKKCGEKKFKTVSLDRIDSKKGYIEGNVQWVHRDINRIKINFDNDYFIKMCKLVAKNNE